MELKNFCTYGTGGKALFFGEAKTWQEMLALREFAKVKEVPYLILGGGSNILFADEGYPGLIIRNRMEKIHLHEKNVVTAESGVNMMKFILAIAKYNLGGLSEMANVPGTVGGAIYGNAGIPGVTISDRLLRATILPENKNAPVIVQPEYFRFAYRDSHIKRTKDIVLSATFKMEPMPNALTRKEVDEQMKVRVAKQPGGHSCGSFFKNPGQFPSAGWLIEQSGCKGMRMGGAQISEKHANFILNTGGATTNDVLMLAIKVHGIVLKKFNVKLEPEVQIVPNNPFLGISGKY